MNRPLRRDLGRLLYLAELLIVVLPLAAILLQFVIFLAFLSFGSLIITLRDVMVGMPLHEDDLILPVGGSLICIFLGVACWQFGVLSINYMRRTRTPRRRWLKRYVGGFLAGLPPLLFGLAVGARDLDVGQPASLWLLYLTGAPILIPVIHLGLARRRRSKSGSTLRPAGE